MNNKKNNVNEPPFYFAEGKGWFIKGKFKYEGKWFDIKKCYYHTKREAMLDYDNAIANRIKRMNGEPENFDHSMQYEDFVELFLEYRRGEVRGSSLSSQELPTLKVFFDPMFKGKPISYMFTKSSCIQLHKSITEYEGRCTKGKNRAVLMYLRMLEYAYLSDFITDEKAYKACKMNMRRIKENHETDMARSRAKHALTLEEVNRLLAYTDGTDDAVFMRLLADTACRINEFCAIKVGDFDFDKRTVTIQRQWALDEHNERFLSSTLKNRKGYRTIPIREENIKLVMRRVYELGLKESDLLFKGKKEAHIDTSAFDKRLKKYCRKAGVTEITSHEFRHTMATIMSSACNNDMERQAVAYILGHSVTVDQEIYAAHASMDVAKEMKDKTYKA